MQIKEMFRKEIDRELQRHFADFLRLIKRCSGHHAENGRMNLRLLWKR